MQQLIGKIHQFISNIADFINPRRVQYRNWCRWADDADRAIKDKEFHNHWRHAEPTLWTEEKSQT